MPPKISIGACRRAIEIAGGSLPVMIRGEQVPITRALRTQGTHWVCGDIQLPRASQEALTTKARAIITDDERPLIPPAQPTISIRECQHAIELAGAIPITLRGAPMRITTLATRDISRWVSGNPVYAQREGTPHPARARHPGGHSVSTPRIQARGELRGRASTASRTVRFHGQERQDGPAGHRRRCLISGRTHRACESHILTARHTTRTAAVLRVHPVAHPHTPNHTLLCVPVIVPRLPRGPPTAAPSHARPRESHRDARHIRHHGQQPLSPRSTATRRQPRTHDTTPSLAVSLALMLFAPTDHHRQNGRVIFPTLAAPVSVGLRRTARLPSRNARLRRLSRSPRSRGCPLPARWRVPPVAGCGRSTSHRESGTGNPLTQEGKR